MSLCRHYVRELRRSMLVETPDLEKATSKRSSQFLDNYNLEETSSIPSSGKGANSQAQKVSAILRAEDPKRRNRPGGDDYSPSHSLSSHHSNQSGAPPNHRGSSDLNLNRVASTPHTHTRTNTNTNTGTGLTNGHERPPRPSFMDSSHLSSSSPGHTVARPDLRASAEKILYTFILPGSEREIVLPQPIVDRMIIAIEDENRDDPEIFDDAKDYVFQAMERDAYPGFLQAKALGNLVPLSILLRLIIGILCLAAGFWAGYWFILRHIPRSTRCWVCILVPSFASLHTHSHILTSPPPPQVILPFTFGSYFTTTYQYKLDLVTAYAGYSEYTWMNWSRVREPYVKRLLRVRANVALLMFLAGAVGLSVLFIFVPGVRF